MALFFRFKKAPAGTLLLRNAICQVQKSPCGHVTAQKCYFSGSKRPLRARYCSEMLFFRFKKAPAGTPLLRNAIFQVLQKGPCGHATAQKCYFSGSKKPLRARYCSEMLFFRFKKTPAGTLLLRNVIFQIQKGPCGHVTAQKLYFQVKKSPCGHATAQKWYLSGSKKPLRARYCSEMPFFRYKKAPAGMSLLRNAIF